MPDQDSLAAGLLTPPPEVAEHPLVAQVRTLCADLLTPTAERTDVEGVPIGHVRALGAAGVLGLGAPAEAGGSEVSAAVDREVAELLAGACGSTWLVATQHRTPLRMVAAAGGEVRARWLSRLASGTALAGTAFTHLRRPGPPPVLAEPDGAGWLIRGRVDWFTGWGLSEVMLLAGQAPDGAAVFGLVDARPGAALQASAPLAMAAMSGTHTVGLTLDGVPVGPDRVVAVRDRADWAAEDATRTGDATPASFGLLRAVALALEQIGRQRRLTEAVDLALRVAERTARLRERGYRLADEADPERLEERLALRAEVTTLGVTASAALVAAGAGSAMLHRVPAQRWAREALFHQVQAQTLAVRAAQLRRFGELVAGPDETGRT